jgi:glycogen debranching enzyme
LPVQDGSIPAPTWMDATVDGRPVTPRSGTPVETAALWYFLLQYLETLHHARGDRLAELTWSKRRRAAGRAFRKRLWIDAKRTLADAVDGTHVDGSVRPNMVIAAALEWSPLTRGKRTDVVQRAEVELLTPRGLRTLAPKNANYIGRYHGTPGERDHARHQGTVWPWLLGFFVEAGLRSLGDDPAGIAYLRSILDGFREQLPGQGLLLLSELSDGDPPHRPLGAIARAITQGELLRAYALLDRASEVAPG